MAWATREQARALWVDSTRIADADLDLYLNAAKAAVLAYAPAPTDYELIESGEIYGDDYASPNWRLAQIMQARNIYNAGRAAPAGGDFDGSSFGIASYPLDFHVKQLLRPIRGLGAIA